MSFDDLIGAIGEEAARQRGAILERAADEAREILRAAEVEGAGLLEQAHARGEAAARAETARVISRARLAARREVLAARQRLVDEAFRALDERLRAFLAGPAYDAALGLLLRECVESGASALASEITVRCRAADRPALERHARSLGLDATFDEAPLQLGGVETAAGPDGRVVSRNAFADRLEAARSRLLQEAGRALFGEDEGRGDSLPRGAGDTADSQRAHP